MDALRALEAQWGGTARERLSRKYAAYAAQAGADVKPPPRREEEIFDQVEAEARVDAAQPEQIARSEEHTSELQSLMRISYAVFCFKKKNKKKTYIIAKY